MQPKCDECGEREAGVAWNGKVYCGECLERVGPKPDALTALVLAFGVTGTNHQKNGDALIAAVKDTPPDWRDANGHGTWILTRGLKTIAISEEWSGHSIKEI